MSSIHTLAEALTELIGLFNNKDKATAVVIIMTIFCAAGGSWIWSSNGRFLSALRRAMKAVDTAVKNQDMSPADRLNVASDALDKIPAIAVAWNQYRSSLRGDPRREGSFINLVDPKWWFALERLGGHGYEKWIPTFGNVALCSGLLFTFIGLSAALMSVGNVDDAARLREAINSILSVSSAKFLTSIFGILYFIAWTVAGRAVLSSQNKAAAKFAAYAQRLSTFMTPEVLLLDQVTASQEQTDRMRTLADDVAIAFEARLTEVVGHRLDAFPAHLGASIRPVVDAIEGMGGQLSRGADDALARVAERLEQAAQAIQTAQGGIGTSGTTFSDNVTTASKSMAETVTRMAESIDARLAGLESRISQFDVTLGNGAKSITGVADGLSQATAVALDQALRTVAGEASRAAAQAREQSAAAMQPLLDSMREMAASIREQAARGSGELVDGGKSAAGLLAAAAKEISDRMTSTSAEAIANIESAAQSIGEKLSRAAEAFAQLERAVAGNVGHMQRTGDIIGAAGTTFGAATLQLRQAAEPVQATLSKVEASARLASDALTSAVKGQENIAGTADRLAEVSRSASQAFESYNRRFAETDQALGRTFQQLVTGILDLSKETNEAIAKMQSQLAEAIGMLRTGIEEMDSTVAGMLATAERLEKAMGVRFGRTG